MLRITMSKSAGGAKKYYSESYYSEGQSKELNYYSEKEQIIGSWGGGGAAKLNLGNDILKQDFAALCDNVNPLNGKILTGRNDIGRTVGYDFTFNASKSVSLAYSLGNKDDRHVILNAFRGAVKDAMIEVETGMQARVRDKGKNENRETDNIVYGEFVHFTTRPIDGVPDPHLHSHCFVFNATYDNQDRKWKAGQFRQIKQDAPYYEAVFQAHLADRLQNLGYVVERTKGSFEIAGIDKATLDKFSRRTKEIEEHAREHNITDDKRKSEIGAKTREDKRAAHVSPEKQEEEWRSRLSPDEVERIQKLKERSAGFSKEAKNNNEAGKALQYSLSHHLERKSVASDKEILATAIKAAVGRATPEEIKKEFDADSNLLKVKDKLRTFITTKDALREEKELINNANSFKNKCKPINENYEITNDILNSQQRAAVKHALSTTDGMSIITGKAGTGKTTLMLEVQKGIIESGKRIYSFAPSSEASRGVLQSEGFNADTVASLIQNKARHVEFKNQVLWVDEAGMLSNKDLNSIMGIAKTQDARIILSGDTRQHNSVLRGDALRIVQKYAGIRSITVSWIQRQKNAAYLEAVKLLSDANIEKGFKKLEKSGSITEITDSKERTKAIAEDYYNSAYNSKGSAKNVNVIAPTHAEGEIVTQQIREKLKEKKVIGSEERGFRVLKNLQYTDAEKQSMANYTQGHVIVFHQNIRGVKAGSRLEVMGHENNDLHARDSNGTPFNIPISEHQKFNVFETKEIQLTKGDKLRITGKGQSNDGKNLFNGTCYSVHGFDKQGNIRLSNGSTLPKDYEHFTLGYVMTSPSAQGKTADKIIVSQSSNTFKASSMEQFYVSVSRGRHAVSIYTDDKNDLMQAVSHSAQRVSATELLSNNKVMQAAVENNRQSVFNKMKEKVRGAVENYRTPQTKNDDISGTNRQRPGKAK